MTRKKKKWSRSSPCFAFTSETITLTQKALNIFEHSLQRTDTQHPNVAFAEETIQGVKGKLDAMSTSIGLLCLTTFDYNEKMVIVTAIQLYALDLYLLPATSQRARELQRCHKLAAYFALSHDLNEEQGANPQVAETRCKIDSLYNERKRAEE